MTITRSIPVVALLVLALTGCESNPLSQSKTYRELVLNDPGPANFLNPPRTATIPPDPVLPPDYFYEMPPTSPLWGYSACYGPCMDEAYDDPWDYGAWGYRRYYGPGSRHAPWLYSQHRGVGGRHAPSGGRGAGRAGKR